MATISEIRGKQRASLQTGSSLDDFECGPATVIDRGIILDDPRVSLFCLDHVKHHAVFVRVDADLDFTQVPFVYQTQFEHATHLITVDYDQMHELAGAVPEIPQDSIFIFTPGRSGSTLLSRILSASGVVYSLSEPDVYTPFAKYRLDGQQSDEALVKLLADCTSMVLKDAATSGMPKYAIKFRNQSVSCMDLLHAASPWATLLFIYRNPISTIASYMRLMNKMEIPSTVPMDYARALLAGAFAQPEERMDGYLALSRAKDGTVTSLQVAAVYWLVLMDEYLMQQGQGIPIVPICYDDLVGAPQATISALFEECGIPLATIPAAMTALANDAQEGTRLARDDPARGNTVSFTQSEIDEINGILVQHRVMEMIDFG